jgi:hypothetical protein
MELEPRHLSRTASTAQARRTLKRSSTKPPKKPTVRQVFALAAVLCEREGIEFPATRDAASELIERLRLETGHPRPRREDTGGLRPERLVMPVR